MHPFPNKPTAPRHSFLLFIPTGNRVSVVQISMKRALIAHYMCCLLYEHVFFPSIFNAATLAAILGSAVKKNHNDGETRQTVWNK